MRMIDFDSCGWMPGGRYSKWQPCTYPRDARGKWAGRKNPVGPQTSCVNRNGMLFDDWPPDRTVTVLQPNVDARIVRVKFVLDGYSAKQLLLNVAVHYGVKRYYHVKMPRLTVVLEGPDFNLIGLVGKYSELYDELYKLVRDTERKFFDQEFGRGCHRLFSVILAI